MREDAGREIARLLIAFEAEVVSSAAHLQQSVFCGDQFEGFDHLLDAAERIARAMNEQARRAQAGQMLNTKLLRFARRMQRIREKQECGDEIGLVGAEDGGLASSVGVSAEEDFSAWFVPGHFAHRRDGIAQTGAVALGLAREWRPKGFRVAKRKVAAQDCVAVSAEGLSKRDEQRNVRVASRAVGEDEGVVVWRWRSVEVSADGGIESVVEKWGHKSP